MVARAPAWVARYIGIPFADRGRDRNGADCWGLVRLVLADRFAIDLPSHDGRYSSAHDRADIARIIEGEKGPWVEVIKGHEREGDVVLARTGRDNCHVGLVVAKGLMLHIEEGIDACTEEYHGLQFKHRFVGIWRHADRYAA